MYLATSRLPHLLSPEDYYDPTRLTRETQCVFLSGWHLVGTRADLPKSGDFLTCDLFGHPVLLRNWEGEYRAAENVCAHRHCLLTSVAKGSAAKLVCQYHGWEYDAEGRNTVIPQARLFAPLDQQSRPRLRMHRAAMCGQLIFVSLAADGPSLRDYLGETFDLCADRFGDDRRQTLALSPSFSANWKVPIENALESYHVPAVHPRTFKSDPGESRSTHRLEPLRTEFTTQLPFHRENRFDNWLQGFERRLLGALNVPTTSEYRHLHHFPNLLFSFTDAISLVQCVLPTSPTTARSVVRQFGIHRNGWTLWKRSLAGAWGFVSAQINRQILAEDFRFYRQVQSGLQASRQPGMLGRCEERIHAFQAWLQNECQIERRLASPCELPRQNGGALSSS